MKKMIIMLAIIMFLLTIGFASAGLLDGLVGYYSMDGDSTQGLVGNVTWQSNITKNGNPVWDGGGIYGGAWNLTGSGSASTPANRLHINMTSKVASVNSAYTMSAWIRFSATFQANGYQLWNWMPENSPYADYNKTFGTSIPATNTQLNVFVMDVNNDAKIITYTPTKSTWVHVILMKNNTNSRVYEGGVLKGEINYSSAVFDTPSFFTFMGGKANVQWYGSNAGAVGYDELAFWNRTLTESEILLLYNNGLGLPYPLSSGETPASNSIPTLTNITTKSTINTVSPFTYNQYLKNITIFINDTDSNVSNITAKLYLYKPDNTIILNGVSMSSISNNGAWVNGTWSYITNTLLDRTGTWLINITVNDSIDFTYLESSFVVNKLSNASITDGYLGYDTLAIRNATSTPTLNTILSYGYNLVGHKLTYSTFTIEWPLIKTAINTTFQQDAKSFIRINFDKGNYTNYTAECNNINANFTDLKSYPYSDGLAFMVLDVNYSGTDNVSNFVNQVSACILSATNNLVPIYTTWNSTGLSADYVNIWNMTRITETDNASYISIETGYLRNTTSLTRIYNGSTTDFMNVSSTYYKNVIANLRAKPTATGQPTDTRAAKLSNSDIIIFNNASTSAIINFNTTIYSNDIWDFTNKNLFKSVNGNISINVSPNSASILFVDNYSRIVLTDDTSSTIYKSQSNLLSTMNYVQNGSADASLSIVGAYDAREELWSPDFGFTNLEFHTYEALEYSQIIDFSPYEIIVIAKESNTPAIVNTSLQVNLYPNILNHTYGYISVADYNNTNTTGGNETNCSSINSWETMKTAEANDWISNYSVNIFIDGFDIGYAATPACFNERIKRIGDYIRYSRYKSSIFNTYTIYQDVANYGDKLMRESCFSRWNGTVGSPVYSYENISLMISNSNFVKSNNKPVICMAFGDVTDYDKMMWDYYAFAVMYGYNTGDGKNNTFRYAQPNFQIQRDINVPNFGTMMQNTYDNTNNNDWSRRYSGGIIHFSPYRNYTFNNGKYYWFDNGQTINSLNIVGRYQIYGSACSSTHNINLIVNDNTTKLIDECTDVGAGQWTANWVSKSFTNEYTDNGHYYIRLYPVSRAEATGMNVYTRANTNAGVHSWWDSSANNPPTAEADWTAYGRSGTIGDFNTTNYQFNITLNKTISQAVDSNLAIINQTIINNGLDITSGNITISSSKSINLPVLSTLFTMNTANNFSIYYNGTKLNYSSNADCLTINPTLTNNVIAGFNHGSCEYNDSGIYKARIYVPNMSTHVYDLIEDASLPIISNITKNNLDSADIVFTWDTDVNSNSTLKYNIVCYQESANIATVCGGLSTGLYAETNISNSGYWYDEAWDAGATIASPNIGYLYVNYTKPAMALSTSKWQLYDAYNGPANYTIPATCFNLSTIQIRAKLNISGSANWTCWNGTLNVPIVYGSGAPFSIEIYEEAMYWDIGNTIYDTTQDISHTIIATGLKKSNRYNYNLSSGREGMTTYSYSEGIFDTINVSISNVTIQPTTAYYYSNLSCNGTFNTAGFESGSTYKWFKNGALIANQTSKTLLTNVSVFIGGNSIMCEYTPGDSITFGTAMNSSVLTILGASSPVIVSTTVNDAIMYVSDELTLSALISDTGSSFNATACKFELNISGNRINYTTTNISGSTVFKTFNRFTFNAGTINWLNAYCTDEAGLSNSSIVNKNITITVAASSGGASVGSGTITGSTIKYSINPILFNLTIIKGTTAMGTFRIQNNEIGTTLAIELSTLLNINSARFYIYPSTFNDIDFSINGNKEYGQYMDNIEVRISTTSSIIEYKNVSVWYKIVGASEVIPNATISKNTTLLNINTNTNNSIIDIIKNNSLSDKDKKTLLYFAIGIAVLFIIIGITQIKKRY